MTEASKPKKTFLRVLAGETVSPPPVWLMRQAGRYLPEYRATREQAGGFLDLCYTPDLAVEVTLQPLRRYNFDAAILFSDILVLPHALGRSVSFKQGEGPVLDALREDGDVDTLSLDGLTDRLAPVLATVSGLARSIPETTSLIGFAGAPWTVATYMLEGGSSKDFAEAKSWMFGRPAAFARLMDTLVEATTRYLIAQIDAGAEAIQLFDTWAGVLPETYFRQWVIGPIGEITRRIHKERPGVPVIGFPKGAAMMYEEFVKETGVDGVGLDASVPVSWAAKTLQPHCAVQGNLDPLLVVAGGEAMEKSIREIRLALENGPFIFNLGHGIVPPTPPENVARLMELVRRPL
ncbi:uroporphyrinogen decarboxylase [Pararhodospirillum oryzae]|uniref:Uroporphyrinogen decarboxylase n=1 Tax=Pararhodospirillum oryzae TaxID=478448 RepID=A0A512H3L2_9PROT|nr:uroporphyrinogen decarboxylase [Pararhodospirillum oryzae]GEO80052.1 uroporphyrinogen decarboxylase [Pararhodospirillum oryzae]